jgi:hypothetical protein
MCVAVHAPSIQWIKRKQIRVARTPSMVAIRFRVTTSWLLCRRSKLRNSHRHSC